MEDKFNINTFIGEVVVALDPGIEHRLSDLIELPEEYVTNLEKIMKTKKDRHNFEYNKHENGFHVIKYWDPVDD